MFRVGSCIWVVVLCILAAISAGASQEAGSIAGTVSDQTAAAIPGATVTLTNSAGEIKTATTTDQGEYQFSGLAPGDYKINISLGGFKDYKSTSVTVAIGQRVRANATLEPAAVTEQLSVQGQAVDVVETQRSDVSGTITQQELTTFGLNGRNFTQLISLAPGVSNQTGQDEAKVGAQGSVKYSVNGGRVEYNSFDVDGGDILNAGLNGSESTLIVYPSLDALSEVQVLTSNYGAQYGRTASGTILATTKSGTSHFHGDLYYFIRNEAFNARNYFDITPKAPVYRKNDLGVTIGGPLFIPGVSERAKSKTFFFFSEELRLEKDPIEYNHAVPSLAERSGDFSDVCPAVDPVNNPVGTFVRSAFPDCPGTASSTSGKLAAYPENKVAISPIAQAILSTNIIPLPNATTGCNSSIGSCFDATVSPDTYWRQELLRIDHNFNEKTALSLRYIHDQWDTTVPVPQWAFNKNSFPTTQNDFYGPGVSVVARLSQTITSTTLNQITFSFTTDHIKLTEKNGYGGGTATRPAGLDSLGYLFNNGFGGKVPGIVIGGNNAAYGGTGFIADPAFMPWQHSNPTYAIKDDFSKVLGKHSLQFGFHFLISQRNEVNPPVGNTTGDLQGYINYSNVNNTLFSTGNSFADFLYGGIRSYTQDDSQRKYYQRYRIGEPYFQDDWQIAKGLSLNLGLRVSLFGMYHEKYNNVYNWVPSSFDPAVAATIGVNPIFGNLYDIATGKPLSRDPANLDPRLLNGLVQCGKNGVPSSCMTGHLFNPEPRVGFAWDPFGQGKMSIRGGYGIFFEHGTGGEANSGSLEGSSPNVLNMTEQYPFGYNCIGGARPGATSCSAAASGAYPLNVTSIPTHVVWPYVQQWSFGVQRELPGQIVAGLAYVGSKGTHLSTQLQLNQLHPVAASLNPFQKNQTITTQTCSSKADSNGQNYFDGNNFNVNGILVGRNDPGFSNLTAACQGTGPLFPIDDTLRTFAPGFGNIYSLQNIADSHYHGLQMTLIRARGPLSFGVSYSYSHSFDDSSDRTDTTFVNSFDIASNRASSNFDQRHLLNVSYIYSFSFRSIGPMLGSIKKYLMTPLDAPSSASNAAPSAAPQGKQSSDAGWVGKLLDDWELSGITAHFSGTPFTIINGASPSGISVLDNAGVANGVGAGSYPDIVGNPYGPIPKVTAGANSGSSIGPLLGNPNAFAAPRGLTFGNAGRNSFRNPSRTNFDMSLVKHYKFKEDRSLEFRIELFNVFNHTQFEIYDASKGNVNNTISCYGGTDPSGIETAGYVDPKGGVNCLAGSSFLHPVEAHRPRTMQFGLKYMF